MKYNKIHAYYFLIFSIIISYAFVRGFRMPGLWSINYYLPSFFDGFYRRGLAGTIIYFLGDCKFNYYSIVIIQFLVLFLLLSWVYYFFQKNILIMLIISLYLISPMGAYLFHEVGYIDQLIYLILFISIALFQRHKYISVILFASSMLIHELTLFVTLPIYFTYLYMTTNNLEESILCVLPSLVLFLIIYMFLQTVPTETIDLFKNKISDLSNYKVKDSFYEIFKNEFTGSRNKLYYSHSSLNQIFLLFFVSGTISAISYKMGERKILSLLIFLVGLSPLLLGIFGWDLDRWYFLSLSSSTIIFVLFVTAYRISFKELASIPATFVLYLIFYSLLISNTHLEYFNGYEPRIMSKSSLQEVRNEFFKIPIN